MTLFTIALPLETLAVGQATDRSACPAHITLVGNFRADESREVEQVVAQFAATTPPLTVAVGDEAWFGPDRLVLVGLVDEEPLRELHSRLLLRLETTVPGFEVIEPRHTRENYRPHRTVTSGARPSRGDILSAHWVSLAELDPPRARGTAVIGDLRPLAG